jgi:hypothetical protein
MTILFHRSVIGYQERTLHGCAVMIRKVCGGAYPAVMQGLARPSGL